MCSGVLADCRAEKPTLQYLVLHHLSTVRTSPRKAAAISWGNDPEIYAEKRRLVLLQKDDLTAGQIVRSPC